MTAARGGAAAAAAEVARGGGGGAPAGHRQYPKAAWQTPTPLHPAVHFNSPVGASCGMRDVFGTADQDRAFRPPVPPPSPSSRSPSTFVHPPRGIPSIRLSAGIL